MTYNKQTYKYDERKPEPDKPSLPPGYLSHGYFDEQGQLLGEQLLITWPKEIARKLSSEYPSLKKSQLRQFFNYVRNQENRLASGIPFHEIKNALLKLDSLAESRVTRKTAPRLFKEFIENNLKWAVKDEKHFKAFIDHFESIVGYYPEN